MQERNRIRVLVACECSGVVRRAFRALGFDAWSCDLEPSDDDGEYHDQGDVVPLLAEPWDLVIAHPPCTHLAVSGARYFAAKRADGRQQQGIDFFMKFVDLPAVPRVCIENPVGIMSTQYRKPDQCIQPYEYGHPESKKTCLWLKGLPKLTPTQICDPGWMLNPDGTEMRIGAHDSRVSLQHYNPEKWARQRWANQTPSGQNKLGPSLDRAKIRSRTYEGIAAAMATQWGHFMLAELRGT
jgi:hypothetical protein